MDKLVSVIVLNWNGEAFIVDCVGSVLDQTYSRIELLVVDNASTDTSLKLLNEKYPHISVVRNKTNEGFSKAVNLGITASKGHYVMPLNFDTVLEEKYVEEMVRAIDSDEKAGSVSGKLLRLDDEGKTKIIDSTGHVIFKTRYVINRGEDHVDRGQYEYTDYVFGTSGAAPLYSRNMLEDIKVEGEYFDESFFIMLEDVDLDWRAQLRGWKCVYTPKAVAYHHRSATGVQKGRMLQKHYYKNRYLMMLKNDNLGSILRCAPQILLMELFLHLDLLLTAPTALFLGWWDSIRLLPQTWRKRRVIQTRRLVDQKEIEQWFQKYNYMADVKRKLHLQK